MRAKSTALLHVAGVGAAHDQRRASIDVAVPDPPRGLIVRVLGQDHAAAQPPAKAVDHRVVQADAAAVQGQAVEHLRSPPLSAGKRGALAPTAAGAAAIPAAAL